MNKTQKEREEFLKKFNELVARMVNLEIIPNIQSQINERIPKQLGFTVYDGTELWNFVEKALAQREAEVRELLEDTLIDMDMSAEDTAYLDLAKDRINKFLSKLKPTQDENRNKAK